MNQESKGGDARRQSVKELAAIIVITRQSSHLKGILLLILTTLIWGTSFPLLKHTLNSLSPTVLLSVRFSIAAIAFIPWLRHVNRRLVQDGILLGCISFAECVSALAGLETISANRSSFLISLSVILVPLLGVLLGRHLTSNILLAATLAVLGVGVMSWEGGGLSQGDVWSLGCATGVAVYTLLLETIARRHAIMPLVAVQLATTAGLGFIVAMSELIGAAEIIATQFNILIYLGLVVTAAPMWIQALGQRWVAAHEAALVSTLEPVFAAIFSFWFLGEGFGLRGFIGAGLILSATVVSQVFQPAIVKE